VITLDGGKLKVESYRLYPIDDAVAGDRATADEIEKLKKSVTGAVFASRGYSIRFFIGMDIRPPRPRSAPELSEECATVEDYYIVRISTPRRACSTPTTSSIGSRGKLVMAAPERSQH